MIKINTTMSLELIDLHAQEL